MTTDNDAEMLAARKTAKPFAIASAIVAGIGFSWVAAIVLNSLNVDAFWYFIAIPPNALYGAFLGRSIMYMATDYMVRMDNEAGAITSDNNTLSTQDGERTDGSNG